MVWLIDLGVCIVVLVLMLILLVLLDLFGFGFGLVLMFLVYWVYLIVCEVWWGCIFGKCVLGLCVFVCDGVLVGWMVVIICNLLCIVDMLLFGYVLGLISSLFDFYGCCFGDLVVGIVVVYVFVLYLLFLFIIDSVLVLL